MISTTALLGLLSAPALAGSVTRAEYVREVEPICKERTLANRGVLEGVEEMFRDDELKRAAARFARAATLLDGALGELGAVPRPAKDVARLGKWVRSGKAGGALMLDIAEALRRGRRSAVERMAKQLLRETRRTNALVVGFDFEYCRVDPGRFV